MKRTFLICLSIIMLTLVGCKKETNTWGKLQESGKTMNVGETYQLTFESNGNECPQWSSSDPFVAMVSGAGMVTAQHVGKATISVNNLTCEIEVIDDYVYSFDEPRLNWAIDNAVIEAYEAEFRGTNCIKDFSDVDTVTSWEITFHQDTVWNAEHTRYEITSVADTNVTIEHIYVRHAEYDYSASVQDVLIDKTCYDFKYSKDKSSGKYSTSLARYVFQISASGEKVIEQILKNRYYTTDDPTVFYYYITEKKLCMVYLSKQAKGTFVTFVPNK